MNMSDLIKALEDIKRNEGDLEVAILDGFNGGGEPREINVHPTVYISKEEGFTVDRGDIKTKSGLFVSMGYGSY
jgi:hypothetical protein